MRSGMTEPLRFMNRYLLLFLLLYSTTAHAQTGMTAPIFGIDQCTWFEEADGSPANSYCAKMILGNGSLTDNGNGSFTLSSSGAPTDADYLVGTANGSLSAEIAVGTTPGGELGNTWASPTLDDSVTVTGWVMGASTATTPSADDDDTSLATTAYVQTELNAAGGRSLSASSGSISADAELFTETKCIWWENPVAGDDFKSVFANRSGGQYTVTDLWCESDQSVTMMLQVDDGSAADMDSVDLVCISTPDTDTSLDGDSTIANGDRVDVDVASVASTPTWVSFCFTYTKDD